MAERDEFSKATRDLLAKRVGSRCSICRAATSGPSAEASESVNVGVAAHIAAAAPNGPRYDSSMTAEQRSSAENGIWLCQTCGARVDRDTRRFTAERLLQEKQRAEAAAHLELGRGELLAATQDGSERSHQLRAGLSSLVGSFDLFGSLRFADESVYERLVGSGGLDKAVDEMRATTISLEALGDASTATALTKFRKAAEMASIHARVRPFASNAYRPNTEKLKDEVWWALDEAMKGLVAAVRRELEPPERRAAREQLVRAMESLQLDADELAGQLRGLANVIRSFGPPKPGDLTARLTRMGRRISSMSVAVEQLAQAVGPSRVAEVRRCIEELELELLPWVQRGIKRQGPAATSSLELGSPDWARVFHGEASRLETAASRVMTSVSSLPANEAD